MMFSISGQSQSRLAGLGTGERAKRASLVIEEKSAKRLTHSLSRSRSAKHHEKYRQHNRPEGVEL